MEGLVSELKGNQKSLSVIEQKLANDKSRTEVKALIDSRKEAKRHINTADKPLLDAQKEKQFIVDGFLSKVAKQREVRGTTDLLILQNYIPLFGKKSEIQALAKSDVDAARALLLIPALKHKFELNDSDLARINDSLAKHVLGDDYPGMVESMLDLSTLHTVRDEIFDVYAVADDELHHHMQDVVELGGEGAAMN
jgi:hypothetical protein